MAVTLHGVAFAGPQLDVCASIAGYDRFATLGRLAFLLNAAGVEAASDAIVVAYLGPAGVDALLESGLGVRDGAGVRVNLAAPKDPNKVRAGLARVAKHGQPSAGPGAGVDPSRDASTRPSAGPDPSRTPADAGSSAGPDLSSPVTGGRGGSGSDQGSSLDQGSGSLSPEPLVLRSTAIEDPLPGKRRRAAPGGAWSAAELATAGRLWALQEELRSEVMPGSRGLVANQGRLERILKLLRGGVTEDDCTAVLRAQAERVRRDPDQGKWFNGDTTWRPGNFDRQLGQVGTVDGGDRRGPVNGFDHVMTHIARRVGGDAT